MEKRLLNVSDLSIYLSLPPETIYTWVSLRKIPATCIVRLGRALRFDLEAIDRWVNSQCAGKGGSSEPE